MRILGARQDLDALDLPSYTPILDSLMPILIFGVALIHLLYRALGVCIPVCIVIAIWNSFQGRRHSAKAADKVAAWLEPARRGTETRIFKWRDWLPGKPAALSQSWIEIGSLPSRPGSLVSGVFGPRFGALLDKASTSMRNSVYGFLLFPALIWWIVFAINAGAKEAKRYYERPSPLHISFKRDEPQLFPPELLSANANGTLMELAQTKDLVVMFVKAKGSKIGDRVFIIPRSNLLAVQNGPRH